MSLGACGGGGGGGGSGAPVILATMYGFESTDAPPGALPAGYNAVISVEVRDRATGAAIGNAVVTLNGSALSYDPQFESYASGVTIRAGDPVTFSVRLGGKVYAPDVVAFPAFPTILVPATGTTWINANDLVMVWQDAGAGVGGYHLVGAVDVNGQLIWPTGGFAFLGASERNAVFPAGSLPVGPTTLITGLGRLLPVAQADPDSFFIINAFQQTHVTVVGPPPPVPTLGLIELAPTRITLAPGATRQLTATGVWSDGSRQDITSQVTWTSQAPGVVSVDNAGLVLAVARGAAVVNATLGAVSAQLPVNVFQVTPSPTPPLSQSVTFQVDPAHSGRATWPGALTLPASPSWSVTLTGEVSYPLIAAGKVFVTAVSNASGLIGRELRAYDQLTGQLAWGPVSLAGTFPWTGHAYDNGRVFVLNSDGLLRAFDAATGASLWSSQLPVQYLFSSPPTAVNGLVYVSGAGSGGTVYAVDALNGALLWSSPVANGDHSSPAVTADGVYVSYPCQIYKFDPLTGQTIWWVSGGCSGGGGRTVAADGARIFVRDPSVFNDGQVRATSTGQLLGSVPSTAIPVLADGKAYVLQGGTLRRIDLDTSLAAWSYAASAALVSAPLMVNNIVFIGASDGTVHALDTTTGALLWTGSAGTGMSATDEHNVAVPYTGMGFGEGYLVVPAGAKLTVWKLSTP
ncbi:outer membrane protein assembly factor BamB family protein [Leptothrix sp. BB-3]